MGFIGPAVYAKATTPTPAPTQAKAVKKIIIYAEPSTSAKVIAQVNPWQRLIPVYQKGDWIKVGNPDDGTIGWINSKQYQEALESLYQPQTKSKKLEIVVYEDGKKKASISEKDFQKLQKQMNQMFQDMMRQFQQLDVNSLPAMLPAVFIVQPPAVSK